MPNPSHNLSAGGSININSGNTVNSYNTNINTINLDRALDMARGIVLEKGSTEDGMLFSDLSHELKSEKPDPKKVTTIWTRLTGSLPVLTGITELATHISTIVAA